MSDYILFLFFFNDTATTEIYTLSLHDALPISAAGGSGPLVLPAHGLDQELAERRLDGPPRRRRRLSQLERRLHPAQDAVDGDRKSTRLNSSHANISYAVFCLKKKKKKNKHI